MDLLTTLIAVAVAPLVIDSGFRLLLAATSTKLPRPTAFSRPLRWVVVVPARWEGRHVAATLDSIEAARGPAAVTTIVLLDGADPEAEALAIERGATVVVKEPPGPTKGAALGWLARERPTQLAASDAVLLLDVGSTLSAGFFTAFEWPAGAAAVQAFLRGEGGGIGAAAAHSERTAQAREDIGRQRLGWSVRLRGTGTALRTDLFLALAGRLVTQVEDTELTLLLASEGMSCAVSESAAFVVDGKPDDVRVAAAQRSRWLAGRAELVFRRWRSFARLVARRPLEGIAFCAEMVGRPLSLTLPLRVIAAAILLWGNAPVPAPWQVVASLAALVSAVSDVLLHARGGGFRRAISMLAVWSMAAALAPRAFLRWARTRRS